jgi:hypothetical protein
MSKTNDTTKIRELTEVELAAVSGGTLSLSFNNVIKTIGEALTTAARKQ